MMIIEDFEFYVKEKMDTFNMNFSITKKEFETGRKAVKEARKFIKETEYKDFFKEVYIVLTDLPINNEFAEVNADKYTGHVFIHLNLVSLIYEYKNKQSVLMDIIFKEKPMLHDFILFFLFHEMGHIIHAQIEGKEKESLYEKINLIDKKYKFLYEKFDTTYQDILYEENNKKLQKAYRIIFPEQIADTYAHILLKEFKKRRPK